MKEPALDQAHLMQVNTAKLKGHTLQLLSSGLWPSTGMLRALPLAMIVCSVAAETQSSTGETGAAVRSEGVPEIVVTGTRPVIVKGRVRPCTAQAGDPVDRVRVEGSADTRGWEPGVHRYMAIIPHGADYVWERDEDQITGPDFWQRVGITMNAYRFRGMAHNKLMCVGGTATYNYAFAGFRRELDAIPYHGKRLRFGLLLMSMGGSPSGLVLVLAMG